VYIKYVISLPTIQE